MNWEHTLVVFPIFRESEQMEGTNEHATIQTNRFKNKR